MSSKYAHKSQRHTQGKVDVEESQTTTDGRSENEDADISDEVSEDPTL